MLIGFAQRYSYVPSHTTFLSFKRHSSYIWHLSRSWMSIPTHRTLGCHLSTSRDRWLALVAPCSSSSTRAHLPPYSTSGERSRTAKFIYRLDYLLTRFQLLEEVVLDTPELSAPFRLRERLPVGVEIRRYAVSPEPLHRSRVGSLPVSCIQFPPIRPI